MQQIAWVRSGNNNGWRDGENLHGLDLEWKFCWLMNEHG